MTVSPPLPLSANVNLPDSTSFAAMAHNIRTLLRDSTALSLSACVFALGEKLAACRTRETPPDAGILAELNAIYTTLADDFAQEFFGRYTALDADALQGMVYGMTSDSAAQTPADVRVMVELYQAVWRLHYAEFTTDPAAALAAWNVNDHYQTRAMRAALFDMEYGQLLRMAVVMLDSATTAHSQGIPSGLRDIITAKRDLILTIVWQRAETPRQTALQVSKGQTAQMATRTRILLLDLLRGEMQRRQERRLETFYADIIPFTKPLVKHGKS
jgi:hypothetical protein